MGIPQARPWDRDGSAEALLARFRDTRDPAALGALFDATAPELFRVAMAIVHDPAVAEDAVQETFLAAISAVSRFQPGRPARPWLLGILRRKIGRARRAGRRPDPSRLLPRSVADETAEGAAQVREAVERLPQPYRAVALLRWRYGLDPAEIAHVRGEPPGTVWAILSRALARLRSALRGGACALFGARPPRGLSSVRQAVVDGHAGGAAAAIGGGVMTKTTAAIVIAAAAAGGYASRGVIDPPVRGNVLASGEPSLARPDDARAVAIPGPAAPALAVASGGVAAPPAPDEPAARVSRSSRVESGKDRKALTEQEVDAQIAELALRAEQLGQVADVLARPSVPSMEALRERLQLGSAQESVAREVVEATQARLVELRRLPDDQGRTWEQVQAGAVQMVGGALRIDEKESLAFRARRIPGRGEKETYGSEEVRLLETANQRIRSALTDEQRAAYDALDPTELFGPLPPGSAPIGWPAELARSLGVDDPDPTETDATSEAAPTSWTSR